ncbi:TPA: hypothetical protein ACXNHL_002622 [Serratia marcescens]
MISETARNDVGYHYCTPTSGAEQWAASHSPMFAIREDEERQHWLYVWHKGRWPLVSETPFENQGKAVDAALAFDFATLYK